MNKDIKQVLLSEEQIDSIVTRIAAEIDRDYADKRLVLVSILKGSVMFTAALMGKLQTNTEIEFMKVSSYGSQTKSTGCISVLLDLKRDDLLVSLAKLGCEGADAGADLKNGLRAPLTTLIGNVLDHHFVGEEILPEFFMKFDAVDRHDLLDGADITKVHTFSHLF